MHGQHKQNEAHQLQPLHTATVDQVSGEGPLCPSLTTTSSNTADEVKKSHNRQQ